MSLRRRLFSLECRPFLRPLKKEDPRMVRQGQKLLALPLPEDANAAERAEALRLMKAAQKLPVDDHSGWLAVRDYAVECHRKYGSVPFYGWPE
ncbi:MAG: hypothetical protein NT138_18725 [Planctomycetales bacterium]|nr:hypothetical protein [Planctomycetales bacterium]